MPARPWSTPSSATPSAALGAIDGEALPAGAVGAAELLALVAGQDVAEGDDGVFRIVRGVAKDRVISTVDPEARHGHKSRNRRFDGYKAHLSIDPDSELIDEVAVTAANTPDRDAVDELVEVPWPTTRTSPRSWATRPMPTGPPEQALGPGRLRGDGQGAPGAQRHGALHQGPLRRRPRDPRA